jgi:hypothetical protein
MIPIMPASMRPRAGAFARIVAVAIALLVLYSPALAQNSKPEPNLYLISAAPPSSAHPATNLYALGCEGDLRLVRTLLATWPYEIADDQQGTLYAIENSIGFPRISGAAPTTVSVVHESKPRVVDTLTIDQEKLLLPIGDGIPVAALSSTDSCLLLPNKGSDQGFRSGVTRIMGTPRPGESRAVPGKWSDYAYLRYAGNDKQSLEGWFTIGKSVHYLAAATVLSPAPPINANCGACTSIDILAASAGFLVLTGSADHVWVYDRIVRKWRFLPFRSLPVQINWSLHTVRIFGVWLAGGETPNGSLQLLNLVTGQTITLPVAADVGEVLAMNPTGTILYRSNDLLFSISLVGGHLGPPVQFASDPIIRDVHWAFWSGA